MRLGEHKEPADQTPGTGAGATREAAHSQHGDASSRDSGTAVAARSLPSISLQKGGGAIRGIGEKFTVNPATGTGSLTVPVALSPGRSGLGPQLNLTYDSGAGNGPFGFGWKLSLPAVTRKTDKGIPQYADAQESDVYILSGAEDLVPLLKPDGTRFEDNSVAGFTIHRYRPRTEGLFSRIERWTSQITGEIHWRSITKDNITTLYGKTGESRIADPADQSRVFAWLICESYDDKGNAILYTYAAENDANVDMTQANERNRVRTAGRYLKRIKYGNVTSRLAHSDLTDMDWLFEVVFDHDEGHYQDLPLDSPKPEAEQHRYVRAAGPAARTAGSPEPPEPSPSNWPVRPDPFSSHRSGFEVRTYRRCRRILMFHRFAELGSEPYLVRATEFDYADFDYSKLNTIDDELAYQGSTRFASFIRAITQSGFVRDETKPAVEVGGAKYFTYLKRSLPPVEFEYSKAIIQDDIQELDSPSDANLPIGLDGAAYRWVDLDGEGVSGILTEQAGAWFYKPNLGEARFGQVREVARVPSLAALGGGRQQLLDLGGDGQLDLVQFSGPTAGFFPRTPDENWESFQTFGALPNIAWDDRNLRFVDLNGDGHADVLITEQEVFTWYPSLAEDGFGSALRVYQPQDEEDGPQLVFADSEQSIYLADMTGDGLTDLARIRNGEICYWPNQGYGRFGAKVAMDQSPWFDSPDLFEQQRIRLADIDGSGTTDLIYLGRDGARLFFNQSGNGWSRPRTLGQFPLMDTMSNVTTADLLGNGTSCLVWSSPLPADAGRPMRYIDLMGGHKPHLLVSAVNNLGAETRITYAPSTRFYLADKAAGKPWITRISFPVQVVERVETYDQISGNRFVTHCAYHHGYFDGVEREFNGFGLVEQWDTEEFASLNESRHFPSGTNVDQSSHIPPVLTRSWFHTGIYLGRETVSSFHAGEYYREPGLTDPQARALLLDDTVLPSGLTLDEEREASRALKGSMLRQEVYALDSSAAEKHPYTVTEQNFTVELLQPQAHNRHAVFFTHPRESIRYHYERKVDDVAGVQSCDPRIAHTLTLEVDSFGNVLKSAAVGYGRRKPDPALSSADQDKQSRVLITYSENDFTNSVDGADDYRAPVPSDARTYELTGYSSSGPAGRFQMSDLVQPDEKGGTKLIFDGEINYEEKPTSGKQRRLIERVRTYYRPNDLGVARNDPLALLPLGHVESLALPGATFKLAFTPGLVNAVYGSRVTATMLGDEGRYAHSESDINWWIPSGRVFYSPDKADTAAQELALARSHFFLPRRYRDPFHTDVAGTETVVTYDAYDLLVQETSDPLGNRVTAGERDVHPDKPLVKNGQNYRVLQPALVMDPNRNRSAVAFDALGLVSSSAVMGKPEQTPVPGDQLTTTLAADLTQAQIDQFFASPKGTIAATLLDQATTRIVYDLARYWREPDPKKKLPPFAATLARETHASEPPPAGGFKIQVSFAYSDGFGREIQKKIQAEAGPVPTRDGDGRIIAKDGQPVMTGTDVSPRWAGSGWTVFNNKGKPVRQYEPFFTDTHRFELDVRIGVSPVLFYDPAGRVVGTLHPDHTWEKVVFDPWKQATWDVNDTVNEPKPADDPKKDPDLGNYFERLQETEYLPAWYDLRTDPAFAAEAARRWPDQKDRDAERAAALKASIHAATPAIGHFDSLGRAFLTVAHNKFKPSGAAAGDPPTEEFHQTRIDFDIEGNQRQVIDARGLAVMIYDYDMLSNRVHQASMDAGNRWMLNDVAGKPLYAWDSRDHRFRTAYDRLLRPIESYLREGTGPELMVGRTVYGESRPTPEANNLRGKPVEVSDQAGVVATADYDFKGNLLSTQRQLAQEYKKTLDWGGAVALETAKHESSTLYDALNRPTELTMPDKTAIRLSYNEANFLEQIEAKLRGATTATAFVTNIDYDAKGQRTLIEYGNGVKTSYDHDPFTFRLARLLTRRDAAAFPADCPAPPPAGWPGCQVQNLHYAYDPIGNITTIRDNAQQKVYFNGLRVEPSAEYTYDAVYRLIEASGREHLSGLGQPTPPDAFNAFHTRLDQPGDGNAMGTYLEQYVYDAVGNIMSMRHRGSDSSKPGWKRCYQYAIDSNRLLSTRNPGTPHNPDDACATDYSDKPVYDETYDYDAHGNITGMPHLQVMQWDYHDQLQATAQQKAKTGTPETTWYVYDSGGQRVRKVTEGFAAAGITPTRTKERIYLGPFEIYREYSGGTLALERETLHIMDDKQRIALVETRTDKPATEQLIRYQFGNHLGSASLELDDTAQVISYEEYYPYGSTSYQSVRSKTETPKRYRYSTKERDEESGFYYHGARYYAPWLGRWTKCDPGGLVDGPDLYGYATCNPVRFTDPSGNNAVPTPGPLNLEYSMWLLSSHTPSGWSEERRVQEFGKWFEQHYGVAFSSEQSHRLATGVTSREQSHPTIGPASGTSIRWSDIEADQKAWLKAGQVIATSPVGGLTYTVRREVFGESNKEALARAEATATLGQIGLAAAGLYAQGKASGTIGDPERPHVGGTGQSVGRSRINDVDPSEGRRADVCVPAAAAVVARRFRDSRSPGEGPETVATIENRQGEVGRGAGRRLFARPYEAASYAAAGAKVSKIEAPLFGPKSREGIYIIMVPTPKGAHAIIGWMTREGRRFLFDPSGQDYGSLGKAAEVRQGGTRGTNPRVKDAETYMPPGTTMYRLYHK